MFPRSRSARERNQSKHDDVLPLETIGVEVLCRGARTLLGRLGGQQIVANEHLAFDA